MWSLGGCGVWVGVGGPVGWGEMLGTLCGTMVCRGCFQPHGVAAEGVFQPDTPSFGGVMKMPAPQAQTLQALLSIDPNLSGPQEAGIREGWVPQRAEIAVDRSPLGSGFGDPGFTGVPGGGRGGDRSPPSREGWESAPFLSF